MIQDSVNIIFKCLILNIYSLIIFLHIKNCKKMSMLKNIILMISTIILSVIYLIFRNNFDIIISLVMTFFLQALILKFILGMNFYNTLISIIIARLISYIFFVVSATIEFSIQFLFNVKNTTINLIITFLLENLIIYIVLKARRIKNGLNFLNTQNEYIEILIINSATILVLVNGLISYNNERIYTYLYLYYMILGGLFILMIQKTITMYYKQKLTDDTINDYKMEIEEKKLEINNLKEEAFKVSKINHEFYNRQKSLEMMVKNVVQNYNTELGEDTDILKRINEVTKEHSKKMSECKSLPNLPSTEIAELDDMFKYMQKECSNNNIQFKLNINGNIYPLVNNIISRSRLETLIGDHIRDAIIAINSSDNSNKEIFTILGIRDNCYEFCVYDTGIEFEIDTLLKLGLEPITTHKDSGGSGLGFMTTFETLKECKASLIIEELGNINKSNYTKSVKIRFDNKNEYRIHSYRATKLEEKCDTNRIIIKSLEENTICKS